MISLGGKKFQEDSLIPSSRNQIPGQARHLININSSDPPPYRAGVDASSSPEIKYFVSHFHSSSLSAICTRSVNKNEKITTAIKRTLIWKIGLELEDTHKNLTFRFRCYLGHFFNSVLKRICFISSYWFIKRIFILGGNTCWPGWD